MADAISAKIFHGLVPFELFFNYVECELYVFNSAAAREVGERTVETLDNGAGYVEATELFERFVENIAGIEVGGNKNVSLALQGTFGGFLGGDFRINRGVKLHFAINNPVGVILLDLFDDEMDFVKIGIFAAGAIGGVGEHGNLGLTTSVVLEGDGGVFDDYVELFLCGEFIYTAVSESENLVAFFADEAAGKIGRF